MSNLSIYLDYDPNHGIENPDQIYKLPVPQEIKEKLTNTIKENLNQEIKNDRPKYRNIVIILVGIFFFIVCMYTQYLNYYTRITLVSISIMVILVMMYMIVTTLPLKERLIPLFLKKVDKNTCGIIRIKENYEYRVKLHDRRRDMSMDEFETLVGFTFSINKKILKKYNHQKELKNEQLLVQTNDEKA